MPSPRTTPRKVKKWLSDTGQEHKPGLMVIELRDSADTKVFTWEMRSAMPAKWSVTGFDASTSKIATETARDRAPRLPRRRHRLIPSTMPQFTDTTQFGLVMRFDVDVAGIDLGAWSSCDGLRVDFGLKEIKSGGNNDYKVYLPDRINYPKLVLKRAMNATRLEQGDGVAALDGRRDARRHRDDHAERQPQRDRVAEWTFANVRPFVVEGPDAEARPARKWRSRCSNSFTKGSYECHESQADQREAAVRDGRVRLQPRVDQVHACRTADHTTPVRRRPASARRRRSC